MNEIDRINKEVLYNILNLKNGKNLSDVQFCKEFGINSKTLDNWKRGKSKSYMNMLEILSAYFQVSTGYLLGNEQKNKPTTESDELAELFEITKDFTPEERAALVEHARLLSLKHNQSKQK